MKAFLAWFEPRPYEEQSEYVFRVTGAVGLVGIVGALAIITVMSFYL